MQAGKLLTAGPAPQFKLIHYPFTTTRSRRVASARPKTKLALVSFWTTLSYVRPTRPPRVTVAELIDFARAVGRLPLLTDGRIHRLQLKRGRRIDQDQLGTEREVEVYASQYASVVQHEEIDWDDDLSDAAAVEAELPRLAADAGRVYRAYVGFAFAGVRDDVVRELGTPRPQDGVPNLLLSDLAIQVNVIHAGGLETDAPLPVGWIAVGIGGRGYLHPWTPADLIARASAAPDLQALAALCRDRFPVRPADLSASERLRRWLQVRYVRRALGGYHPYSGGPLDWSWSIAETG